MVLGQLAKKAAILASENSSTILTAVGIVGSVSTAVLTGRASLKAARLIDAEKMDSIDDVDRPVSEGPFNVDIPLSTKVKLVWPQYIPPVACGVITIASIILAHRIDAKRIAALAVASGVSERALQEYKAKVQENLTKGQAAKIRDDIAQDRVLNQPPISNQLILMGNEVLCYDSLTGRYFKSTVEDIKRAEIKINHDIMNHMGASLAEFQDLIGLPSTTYTDSVGWNTDTLLEIQFSSVLTADDKPCLVLDYNYPPTFGYHQLN